MSKQRNAKARIVSRTRGEPNPVGIGAMGVDSILHLHCVRLQTMLHTLEDIQRSLRQPGGSTHAEAVLVQLRFDLARWVEEAKADYDAF